MNLKELYQRFRTWQREPIQYKKPEGKDCVCANCGTAYHGSFCPVCGQNCNDGKVTWKSVDKDFRELLEMKDSAGLASFILQLFLRPGYLIRDYLNGKRKACTSPVVSLIVIAMATMLVQKYFGHPQEYDALFPEAQGSILVALLNWMSSNLSLAIIIQTVLLIFPTWLLFRYAPVFKRHTLPEGFHIQLFMGSLVLIIVMLRCLVGDWVLMSIPFFYYVAYRQLFQYSVWGTLWRTIVSIGCIPYFFAILMMSVKYQQYGGLAAGHSIWAAIGVLAVFYALGFGILALGWWISKRTEKSVSE